MKTEIENPKPYLGRPISQQIDFKVDGAFQSMYAAQHWLKDNQFGYGSSDAMNPTPVTYGDYYKENNLPHKWHNFSDEEKKTIAGVITGDLRNGPVAVRIFADQQRIEF